MENKKEMTAPNVSVGADTEQPIRKNTTSSISENGEISRVLRNCREKCSCGQTRPIYRLFP